MVVSRRAFLTAGTVGLMAGPWTVIADDGPASVLVDDVIGKTSLATQPSLQFHGSSPMEFHAWQKEFQSTLGRLLGDHDPPAKWQVVEESRREFDDHTRLELRLRAEGVPDLPLYLLVPTAVTANKPVPAVLCIHGHGPYGNEPVAGRRDLPGVSENIKAMNYDYGLQFVRRGYVVAVPCMIPFGRRVDRSQYHGQDPCAVTFVRMQALGQLPIAANIRDLRWTLSFLQSRPEVRGERIGCAGLSYGGRMTMLVTAVDDRIQVAAVSGALNLLQERITSRYSCGLQIIPGLLKHGDYSEIGSLIAPRPCVWEVGSTDPLVTPVWAKLFKQRLERAYQALGVAERLRFDHFTGGHRWNGEVAYPLFDSVLKS